MPETEWDVTTLYDLLTYTDRHLGNVDEGTLGAGNHRLSDIVVRVLLEVLLCVLAVLIMREIQPSLDMALE